MIRYSISLNNPNRHFINIQVQLETEGAEKMVLHLPSWRPGRYELANYAQNIQQWAAFDEQNNRLHSRKLSKDSWEVNTAGTQILTVKYNYYAYQLDAGASYYDEHQLYINPVNCLLYIKERIYEPCTLKLNVPENWQIASALNFDTHNICETKDYHQLADSPFIASAELMHREYEVEGYKFHIWIKGTCKPDWDRILNDFQRFSAIQIQLFGELPVKEYHFLYQLPNHKFYHGVEHLDSTVICIGPGFRLMDKDIYTEFLGISSHELFHSWNIKSIRPVEMYPYDYSRENYTNLGYVAEGVTTYYGDLMLFRSGVFSWDAFANEMSKFMQRHFHNYGRHYMSLAESSFDTWLDGYKPGVPDRKISMYVKGMLIGFMLDTELRKDTGNKQSLDNILYDLYYDFAKKGRGFSEQDYQNLVEQKAGRSYQNFFERFVWGLEPIEQELQRALNIVGLEFKTKNSHLIYEDAYGFRLKDDGTKAIVAQTAPGSPADISMLSLNDEIIAINGLQVDLANINDICKMFLDEEVEVSVFRNKTLIQFNLKGHEAKYFPAFSLHKIKEATPEQKENYRLWAKQEF